MELTLTERIVLPEIFPEKGSISEQMTMQAITEKLAFTDKEKESFSIKQDGATIKWNASVDTNTFIEFTDAEIALMRMACIKLDEQKQVTKRTLSVCKKILGI